MNGGDELSAAVQPFLHLPGQEEGDAPVHPDDIWNALDQPLLQERERTYQLKKKWISHYNYDSAFDCIRLENHIKTQLDVEIEIEKSLRLEGYSAATINRTRDQIRDLILYNRQGFPVKETLLERYLAEMSTDFRTSRPCRLLFKARDNHDLSLYKPGEKSI